MTTLTVSSARRKLYRLVDETARHHQPVQIMGKRHNAVLVCEEDWRCIEETLDIASIPGMKAKLKRGHLTPVSQCAKKIKWS